MKLSADIVHKLFQFKVSGTSLTPGVSKGSGSPKDSGIDKLEVGDGAPEAGDSEPETRDGAF
jgi:hypothetical protein